MRELQNTTSEIKCARQAREQNENDGEKLGNWRHINRAQTIGRTDGKNNFNTVSRASGASGKTCDIHAPGAPKGRRDSC